MSDTPDLPVEGVDVPEPSDGYTEADKADRSTRPTPLPVRPEAIDAKLKSYPQWVAWRMKWDGSRGDEDDPEDGEWSKLPINPTTGTAAKSNEPETAASFEDALAYHERDDTDTDGIGFIVSDSPFAAVDWDGVFNPESGEFEDSVADDIETLGSYAEFSPSGRGGRAFAIGDLPAGGRKGEDIEVYDSGRYVTVTGWRVNEADIVNRDEGEERLADLHAKHFGDEDDDGNATVSSFASASSTGGEASVSFDLGHTDTDAVDDLTDEDEALLATATAAENGEDIAKLWEGRTDGYPSHSEADQALCNHLAFYTGNDAERMDRMFRASGLNRGKWTRDADAQGNTYGERTIAKAIADTDEAYGQSESEESSSPAPSPDGGFSVHNGGYGYWTEHENEDGETYVEWTEWTNFELEVTAFLTTDEGEEIRMTVHPRDAESYDVTVEPTALNEVRSFKSEVCTGRTTTFTGGSTALAKLKQFIGTQAAAERRGVRHMGRHGDEWVTPNGVLTADGWVDDPEHSHLAREIEAEHRYALKPSDGTEYDADAVAEVLKLLPQTRISERLLPALGWFYSTPLRPLIYEDTGEFNHLMVTGETEAGKTSTLSMLWAMFGMDGEPLSADDTVFTLQATLGSSNAVPMWFDEYKPSDMDARDVDRFHTELRKTTRGGTSQRGRPDGSTYSFHLHAPTVISGEENVQGSADQRRGIHTTFRDAATEAGSDYTRAYAAITGDDVDADGDVEHIEGIDAPLTDHALAYTLWVLRQDSEELLSVWRESAEHVAKLLHEHDLDLSASLARQGLQTIKFGCTLYRAFAAEMGVSADTLDANGMSVEDIDNAILYSATGTVGGTERQSHLDTFVSLVARAAHAGYLEEGEAYAFVHRGTEREELRINLGRSYDSVAKYVRDHDVREDLLNSASDYRSRVSDSVDKSPYLRKESANTPPIGRCIGVHTESAEETVVDFERGMLTGEVPEDDDEDESADEAPDGRVDEKASLVAAAEPIGDLAHGGNPYRTVTAEVLSVRRGESDRAPALTGVLADETGAIDLIAWDGSDAVDALAKSEGETVAIDRARLTTDQDGDDQLDVQHAVIKPIESGVGHTPQPRPSPSSDSDSTRNSSLTEALSDGSGQRTGDETDDAVDEDEDEPETDEGEDGEDATAATGGTKSHEEIARENSIKCILEAVREAETDETAVTMDDIDDALPHSRSKLEHIVSKLIDKGTLMRDPANDDEDALRTV